MFYVVSNNVGLGILVRYEVRVSVLGFRDKVLVLRAMVWG